MRFGFVNVSQPPNKITGITVYAWSLLEEMAARSTDEIVLFSPWAREDLPFNASRLEVVTLPYIGSEYRRVWQEQVALPKLLKAHHIDAVLNVVPVVPGFNGPPTAIISHDLYAKVFPQTMRLRNRLLEDVGYRMALRKAAATITVSENTKRDVERFYGSPGAAIQVVHAAASPPKHRDLIPGPEQSAAGRYVLFVANVSYNKNPEVLAQAAALVADTNLQFIHVGRDPNGLMAEAIRQHGVEERFRSVGPVSDEDLARWYSGAFAVVMPSIYEGFGLPALEAQAWNVPLISSTGGALPEVVGEGALLFDPYDAGQLAQHLQALAADPSLVQDLVRRGTANLTRFSWARSADEMLAILRTIAQR